MMLRYHIGPKFFVFSLDLRRFIKKGRINSILFFWWKRCFFVSPSSWIRKVATFSFGWTFVKTQLNSFGIARSSLKTLITAVIASYHGLRSDLDCLLRVVERLKIVATGTALILRDKRGDVCSGYFALLFLQFDQPFIHFNLITYDLIPKFLE